MKSDKEVFRDTIAESIDLVDWVEKHVERLAYLADRAEETLSEIVARGWVFGPHWQRTELYQSFTSDVWRWASSYANAWSDGNPPTGRFIALWLVRGLITPSLTMSHSSTTW